MIIKLKSLLTELFVKDITKNGSDFYIFAYREYIFILDDLSDITPIWNIVKDHPSISNYTTREFEKHIEDNSDNYQILMTIGESSNDFIFGQYEKESHNLYILRPIEINPITSKSLYKIANQLNLKVVSKQDISDDDGNAIDLKKKKLLGNLPKAVFHGTSSKELYDILKYGLVPGKGDSNFDKQGIFHEDIVFFTALFNDAKFYAENSSEKNRYNPIILELSILDLSKVIPDYDASYPNYEPKSGHNKSEYTPLRASYETGKFGYQGRIPSKFIKWIYIKHSDGTTWKRYAPPTVYKKFNLLMGY